MDCGLVDLVGYHFATLDDDARARVDEHLVRCTACLRTFIAIKHRVEDERGDKPSDAARARLRRAVEERFRPTPAARVKRWLRRPIPLYHGLAAAVLALLAAAVAPSVAARGANRGEPVTQGTYVDTARPVPESQSIY